MLFMQPGSEVLELEMQDDGASHYYYTLLADLDINYYYQFCTPNDPALSVQDADLFVDLAEFKRSVTQLLADWELSYGPKFSTFIVIQAFILITK